jgi:hypothetical protein
MGQSLTELKNKTLVKIISDLEIVKALVINTEDFLEITPTEEQDILLQSSSNLIRTQIFPYKSISLPLESEKTYITSAYTDIRKENNSNIYKNGIATFWVIIPRKLEKTNYGIRYDFICDKLVDLFENGNIGEFELNDRGDFEVGNLNYLGHYVRFKIKDFYGV